MSDTEKPEGQWEELDLTDDEPTKIPVTFTHADEHDGRIYRAGGTRLDILGFRNQAYIAMMVEQDGQVVNKFLEMDEAAHKFFVAEGLPEDKARELISLAAAERDNS